MMLAIKFASLAGICCIMYNLLYVVVYVAHVMESDHEVYIIIYKNKNCFVYSFCALAITRQVL